MSTDDGFKTLVGKDAARLVDEGRADEVLIWLPDAIKWLGISAERMRKHLAAGQITAHAGSNGKVYVTAQGLIDLVVLRGQRREH